MHHFYYCISAIWLTLFIMNTGCAIDKDFISISKNKKHENISFDLMLAQKYEYGEGCQPNINKAIQWYTMAAERGSLIAQHRLGRIYQRGQKVPTNFEKAFFWYAKAAASGYASSQYALGSMYWYGEGVTQNNANAFYWFSKAARQGFPLAQAELAYMYYNGLGIPTNYIKAYIWNNIAGANGMISSSNFMKKKIEENLTIDQILEAQKVADELWVKMAISQK